MEDSGGSLDISLHSDLNRNGEILERQLTPALLIYDKGSHHAPALKDFRVSNLHTRHDFES